jgi:hypothetical protein
VPDQTIGHKPAVVAAALVVCVSMLSVSVAGVAFAQSGGGAGGGGGTGGGAGGSAGSTGGTGTGGSAAPGGTATAPTTRTPSSGPQSRSPAMRPSPVPQADTGVPPVPSAGNAEPNSPIYRQDVTPGAAAPQPDAGNPAATGTESKAPQMDAPIGGSGGSSVGSGSSGAGDPLAPTDSAGNPALGESGPKPNSISEEPNRIKRAGAAGKDLDDCMKLWDPGTHMTKARWKETCERQGR